MSHHPQLVLWERLSWFFFTVWTRTKIILFATSPIAGFPGVSHHTSLKLLYKLILLVYFHLLLYFGSWMCLKSPWSPIGALGGDRTFRRWSLTEVIQSLRTCLQSDGGTLVPPSFYFCSITHSRHTVLPHHKPKAMGPSDHGLKPLKL
jgi:hypothetical protein